MQKIKTKDLTIMALLIALEVVLSRFLSINAWNTRIGFGFVPIVTAAILMGPVSAAVVAGVADVIGALLFPTGAFFPGFTFTALLSGTVYGLFLYKKQTLPRIVGAVAVHQLCLSLLLNTLWISILYGSPFKGLIVTRIPQTIIIFVFQVICIPLIAQLVKRLKNELNK